MQSRSARLLTVGALVVVLAAWSNGCSLLTGPGGTQQDVVALHFDGVDDIARVSTVDTDLNSIAGPITVMAWVYADSFPGVHPRIFECSDDQQFDRVLLDMDSATGEPEFNVNGVILHSITPISTKAWHHVAGTWDGIKMRIYVDGELTGIAAQSSTLSVTEGDVLLGNNVLSNRPFAGAIREVWFWRRALSEQEVSSAMNTPDAVATADVAAAWRLSEGSGQTIEDLVGNADGSLGLTTATESVDPAWITLGFRPPER